MSRYDSPARPSHRELTHLVRSIFATLPRMRILRQLRPRFTLRAMLVAMTLASVFLGYHIVWIQQRRSAFKTGWVMRLDPSYGSIPRAPGLLPLLGERGHWHLLIGNSPSDAELAMVQALFPEAKIDIPYFQTWDLPLNDEAS